MSSRTKIIKKEECDSCGEETVEVEYDISEVGVYGGHQEMLGPMGGSKCGYTTTRFGGFYYQICPTCLKKKNPLQKQINRIMKEKIESNLTRIKNSEEDIIRLNEQIKDLRKENNINRLRLRTTWSKSDYIMEK